MNSGLSAHIGNVWKMMSRANHQDGFWSDTCGESMSLETLSSEITEEMTCQNRKQCKCKKEHERPRI
jgi:hypothetical protein